MILRMLLMAEGVSLGPNHDQAGRDKIDQRKEKGGLFNPHSGHRVHKLKERAKHRLSRRIAGEPREWPHSGAGSFREC